MRISGWSSDVCSSDLLLGALARLLGVIVPSNLLFALAIALLIGVSLHLSWELSRAEEEIRRVAEEVAIMRADLDELRSERGAAPEGSTGPLAADADPRSTD